MGRGRARAKQTKVARDLKYRTFDTDFSSLERELRGAPSYESFAGEASEESGESDDPYAPEGDEGDGDEDDFPGEGRNYG